MGTDHIVLTVPARGEYAKTVRVTVAELASRLGMSYDGVDDMRLAAEEAFVFACERAGEDGEVTFELEVAEDTLVLSVGPLPDACPSPGDEFSESYASFILHAVCDEFGIEHGEHSCTLRLVKRADAVAGDARA